MTLAIRVLAGLVAGFLLGLALAGSSSPAAILTIDALTPVGTIFVNLIRMTVIPLLVTMLVANVGAMTSSRGLGRTGLRALLMSIVLLVVATIGSVLIAVPVLARIPIEPAAAATLRESVTAASSGAVVPQGPATLAQWVAELVPQNVIKAAADGAIVPVILFAVMLGLALTRVTPEKRDGALRAVEGFAEAMQRLVTWILGLAPVGVFALAVPLAARLGWSAAGAVITYVVLVVTLTAVAVALVLYPIGVLVGRMSISAFAAYCAPAQAIAFASRSSLAALPAMVASAERAGLPPGASRVVLPLSLSLFHFGSAIAQAVGVTFLARLFDVTLSPPQLAAVMFTVVLASFAVPGIPGGSIIAMVPVLDAANLPIDGVAILLAVDTIPDMFRTTANVTGALTLTAVLPAPQD